MNKYILYCSITSILYIYIILIIFVHFIGSVEIDAAVLGIGSVIFTLTASDNEGDNLYYGITCNPSGCPFVLLDCKYDKYVLYICLNIKVDMLFLILFLPCISIISPIIMAFNPAEPVMEKSVIL